MVDFDEAPLAMLAVIATHVDAPTSRIPLLTNCMPRHSLTQEEQKQFTESRLLEGRARRPRMPDDHLIARVGNDPVELDRVAKGLFLAASTVQPLTSLDPIGAFPATHLNNL